MRLSKVVYEIFETDAADPTLKESSAFHIIDREIHLYTDQGELFISWDQVGVEFEVTYKDSSFFVGPAEVIEDFLKHPIWEPLVGSEFEIVEVGPDDSALELRGPEISVFCSPFEEDWSIDVVHVSNSLPEQAT